MEAGSALAAASAARNHRVVVSDQSLRDDLLAYLRENGWIATALGEDSLRAHWGTPGGGDERVGLSFSVAVWRSMNGQAAARIEFEGGAPEAPETARRRPFIGAPELEEEIRTALTPILGYVDVLLAEDLGALTDEQRCALEAVQRSADRLAELLAKPALAAVEEPASKNAEAR
jgi:signal transduction histidine kinase